MQVEGTLRVLASFELAEAAPHPNPLPAKGGEREKMESQRGEDGVLMGDQRATALVERTESLIAGNGSEQLVEVPFVLGL